MTRNCIKCHQPLPSGRVLRHVECEARRCDLCGVPSVRVDGVETDRCADCLPRGAAARNAFFARWESK